MAQGLAESRAALQAHLGGVSEQLCWPQGYFDADYINVAHEAGFRYLYTTRAFGQNRAGTNPAGIYRFAVSNTSGPSLGRRIRITAPPPPGPLFTPWKLWISARTQNNSPYRSSLTQKKNPPINT